MTTSTRASATAEESTAAAATRARFVTDLSACGKRLLDGDLVAFPTETVYGLGAHAWDATALAKIFAAKERPRTDPLIVHVSGLTEALQFWQPENCSVLTRLAKQFWPGPLTIVARAQQKVPDILMAGTGFVACRSPLHATARTIVDICPVAAPSANKFGHVSPTTAQHVWDDLHNEDVWIVHEQADCCAVGVESTVIKVSSCSSSSGGGGGGGGGSDDSSENCVGRVQVTVLRQGAVSETELRNCLSKTHPNVKVSAQLKRQTKDKVANVAPGQTIRHYSPAIPSFMVDAAFVDTTHAPEENEMAVLSGAVVIDYQGQFKEWEYRALGYRDLSPTGHAQVAAKNVFDILRWAEGIQGAHCVLFPCQIGENENQQALDLAVQDRLSRAASGIVVQSLEQVYNRVFKPASSS